MPPRLVATESARHRPSRIHNPRAELIVTDPAGRDDRIMFLGDDQTGRALEVTGVELADGTLYVIHVMDLRTKYRADYEKGMP